MIGRLKQIIYLQSGTLRSAFFLAIVSCLLAIVLYTQKLVKDLRAESRQIVEFYAQTIQRIATADVDAKALGWAFENITRRITFPFVLTQADGEPASWINLNVPENDRSPEAIREVKKIISRMEKENPPVPIVYDGQIINYLYYGDSKNISRLAQLPAIAVSTIGLLILLACVGFKIMKRSEQRFIWVGMSKETAHQLGTPISSLMGWVEILRSSNLPPKNLQEIVNDIEIDVKRLEKVASRFSQIGSQTELKVQELQPIFRDIIAYFRRRLPQTAKEVRLIERLHDLPPAPVNRDLFEWALENLIKNAIDAVRQKQGIIILETGLINNKRLYIDVRDNGIGISAKHKYDIFKPGFSTKKRGWGLGLSLAKRIIEEYHHGKLYVLESRPNEGTTMRIELPLAVGRVS
ncbi:MAG: HAMP domain-containing histidine kinase [candidate division KSB1 bacterium]|nr:HAMP domain-containing histidine kinase [candidate division KSB1 bacterium]